MKVDLCDLRRQFRAFFFASDRDVTLQSDRHFYLGSGTQITDSKLIPDGNIVLMFSGAVVDIPTDWQLADGTNGTTDLRNMFVVGAGDTYNPGDTGGADTVDISHTHGPGTLATDTAGSHTHTGNTGYESSHTHGDGSYAAANDTHNHASGTIYTANNTTSHIVQSGSGADLAAKAHDHNVGGDTADDTHGHDVTGTSGTGSSHRHTISASGSHSHSVDSGATASGGDTTHDNRPSFYALCFIMRPTV